MGSVGSVQCQIVPCSSLYLFSSSIGAPQMHSLSINRVLICYTCYFQSGFLFFVFFLAPSDCKSLQCLISTLTQGGKGGHLFRLTCSVVLWGGRNTVNKYHWHAWGVLIVDGPHWVCHRQIATAKAVCISWVHTAQAPGCSARVLSQVGPAFHAHPRSK